MITRFTWHNNMNFKTAMDISIELQGDPGPRGFQGEQGISGENASTHFIQLSKMLLLYMSDPTYICLKQGVTNDLCPGCCHRYVKSSEIVSIFKLHNSLNWPAI